MTERIQRSRRKLPPGAIYVGRPTKYGNPFTHLDGRTAAAEKVGTAAEAVERFRTECGPGGPGFGLSLHPGTLEQPYHWAKPRRVFVNSMSDLFHPRVPVGFIAQVFEVMAATPRHTYQVLTKRSQRLCALAGELAWPPNVWMGVSIENDRYRFRADHLRQVPAAVRFLSVEPMLAPVDLGLEGIGWVIAGGESGPGARPLDVVWARQLRDACQEAAVPFFFKQWGGRTPKTGGRLLDGRTYDEMPQ